MEVCFALQKKKNGLALSKMIFQASKMLLYLNPGSMSDLILHFYSLMQYIFVKAYWRNHFLKKLIHSFIDVKQGGVFIKIHKTAGLVQS